MPYVKIWIHAVWTTKNRTPFMVKSIRQNIFSHIHQNALAKEIFVDIVNGYSEHVHCLFRLKNDQCLKDVMQLLKGESSFWINKQKLTDSKFRWQEEYFAISVSESQVGKVRKYIKNQEEHHQKKAFQLEYDEFIEKYGFNVFSDGE